MYYWWYTKEQKCGKTVDGSSLFTLRVKIRGGNTAIGSSLSAKYIYFLWLCVAQLFLLCTIFSLFNDTFSVTQTIYRQMKGMMNWKGCGRKRSWPNLTCYPGICPEGLRKPLKPSSQDSWSLEPRTS
jgi:hypothetical protein